MITLGPLAFAAPWALIALFVLPLLWLLLKATPPAPHIVVFAPLRLLQHLAKTTETPQSTPWWLIVLRMMLAALIVLALARPVWNPQTDFSADRPLLVVVDDGWSAAPRWSAHRDAARARLIAARNDGRDAVVMFTATPDQAQPLQMGDAYQALARLDAHIPHPWPASRVEAAARIRTAVEQSRLPDRFDTIWISDGLASLTTEDDRTLARLVSEHGALEVVLPLERQTAMGLTHVAAQADGFTARVVRAGSEFTRPVSLTALSEDGQALTRVEGQFQAGQSRLDLSARLPLDLRNRVARVTLDRQASAGGVHVTGDRWRRPRVGVLTAGAGPDSQPLLSDLHYVREGLNGAAETVEGDLAQILETNPAALVMVDAVRTEDETLTAFVEEGGLLIRFAGPRLAGHADDLLPVRLREGGRLFGGAMAWDNPQGLAPFADDSPIAGLIAPREVQVTRQVLAEPGPELDSKVWARLTDGTPLVTADRRGQGWIVLFHVTAGPDWSSLPLSGLYPLMLERVLALADGGDPVPTAGAWELERMLSVRGQLIDPRSDARLIPAADFAQARASAATPPGLWALGAASAALNVLQPSDRLAPLARDLPGARYVIGDTVREARLGGLLLSLALLLLAADGLITLLLSGRLHLPRSKAAAGVMVMALGGVLAAPETRAQVDSPVQDQALEVRLAYVLTGDSRLDRLSQAAMSKLSRESTRRSAVEPSDPVGVNIETDEILFFPLLYWSVTEDAPALSETAADRITDYMNAGGLIVFDTRDGRRTDRQTPHPGLMRLLEAVDVPALQIMPDDHVLGRTFYLLTEFPGRYPDAPIWVESNPEGSARDGVSSVIIGSADWSSAWAVDEQDRPLAPVEGGPRQRELAIRFGVNMAMYALTGNYKADQVHVPAILERLGQD